MKKILFALVAVTFLVTPAMAGNQPEYDAVGCDATSFFNDFVKVAVCERGMVNHPLFGLIRINEYSDFPYNPALEAAPPLAPPYVFPTLFGEFFQTTAGQMLFDDCFTDVCPNEDYTSALVVPYNQAIFRWQIVLQKKPESDIDLNIRDCVTKHNTFNIWTEAEQTGRYRMPWGELFFIPTANPQISVIAFPGPYPTIDFDLEDAFFLNARIMPGLTLVPLRNALYTSKALWEESLVLELPRTGVPNGLGQMMYDLHAGDYLWIEVRIPPNNTVDLRYGRDNVTLKYIGIVGTEFVNENAAGACGVCEGCI